MVDEKITDECWVTVVATGYGGQPATRSTASRLQEPAGEPRVRRTDRSDVRSLADELEIPEFVPGAR
jgi:cell division protein FtsZ